MKWLDSFKKWQRSFFHIRSVSQGQDWVNFPPFADTELTGENWRLEVRNDELLAIGGRLKELKGSEGLMPSDVVAAIVSN